MIGIISIFVLNEKILSSNMNQVSQHINYINHKIHYFDQTINLIVDLGNKKESSNDHSYPKLTDLQNKLLMITSDTPEKDISNYENKTITRKVRNYYVKYYYALFSCSIHAMYNRVHSDQSKHLTLNHTLLQLVHVLAIKYFILIISLKNLSINYMSVQMNITM